MSIIVCDQVAAVLLSKSIAEGGDHGHGQVWGHSHRASIAQEFQFVVAALILCHECEAVFSYFEDLAVRKVDISMSSCYNELFLIDRRYEWELALRKHLFAEKDIMPLVFAHFTLTDILIDLEE